MKLWGTVLVYGLLSPLHVARYGSSLSSLGDDWEVFLSQGDGVCLIGGPLGLLAVRLSHRYHSKRSRLSPPNQRTTSNGRSGRSESCREQAEGEGTLSAGGHDPQA